MVESLLKSDWNNFLVKKTSFAINYLYKSSIFYVPAKMTTLPDGEH